MGQHQVLEEKSIDEEVPEELMDKIRGVPVVNTNSRFVPDHLAHAC